MPSRPSRRRGDNPGAKSPRQERGNMKLVYFLIISFLFSGCSSAMENQPQNIAPLDTISFLPPEWTETAAPVATHTSAATHTPTATIAGTDTPAITQTSSPLKDPVRYTETAYTPNFSYLPPRGWQMEYQPPKASPFKDAAAWMTSDRKCRLNFRMMASGTMTAEEFIQYQMDGVQPQVILSEGPFPNAAGLDTYRAVFQVTERGPVIMYYEFHQGVFMLEGAYSCNPGNNAANDKLIDATMYSMRFES
jgi:hypothetical protein